MNILLDDSLFYGAELFAKYPGLITSKPEEIDTAAVQSADVLICRSKVRIDASLIGSSKLKFIGSATAGVDHVDLELLCSRGIPFAAAPGRNAGSVADYVIAAFCKWLLASGRTPNGMRAGIIGRGNVGRLVANRLRLLGLDVLVSDPPLEEQWDSNELLADSTVRFAPLESVLKADVVSLHTSLVQGGEHSSYHLLDTADLNNMPTDSLLVSCGRGEVVANEVLAEWAAATGHTAVIDVWEGEPVPDQALINSAWLLTPHIAGYSLDGRVLATFSVRDSMNRQLNIASDSYLAGPPDILEPKTPIRHEIASVEEALTLITEIYDPERDHERYRRMRQTQTMASAYSTMRKDYWRRRDFSSIYISGARGDAASILAAAGFSMS